MATKNIGKIKNRTKQRQEHVIDATDQILGRLATEIARLLQGKHLPNYVSYLPANIIVKVKNASKVKVSGSKEKNKVYYHHTGYIGHLKSKRYEEIMAQDGTKVLRLAVFNMLPKNFLRQRLMNHLKIES
jgi:large subunit ribosomal protein L13